MPRVEIVRVFAIVLVAVGLGTLVKRLEPAWRPRCSAR
jgi:hypothetical protein